MTIQIRPVTQSDLDALKHLTVLAFEPIFASFQGLMGPSIYSTVYPDWKKTQRDLVQTLFDADTSHNYMAEVDGQPAGLVTYKLNHETKVGEIEFLVVHPGYQNQGIGTQLNQFALAQLTEGGMQVAEVGTGGDPSHVPARRAYEKAGFIPLPLVVYFKDLTAPSHKDQ